MSNVSVETLEKLKENMVGRRYKHFKGRTYIVNDIAVHTESDEIMVIYKCFTDPFVTWCRPLSMFTSDVDRIKYSDVKQKKRFEPLSEQEV
jgi:hypothetical protein|nr:MAG TPA: Protein of unknown function (DUF1653) [Caudoviricetes sp.]